MGGRLGHKWTPGVALLLCQHPPPHPRGMRCSGPGTGPKPTRTTHSRPGHACPHARIPHMHAHTHTHVHPHPGRTGTPTNTHGLRHAPPCPQHGHTFTLRLQNVGPGKGEAERGPGAHPLFDPRPQGPILSWCEMCNSRGWHPSAPGGKKGAIPAPILGKGWGWARGAAGLKGSRKEALVRHRTGRRGGRAPNVPPASSTGSGEQLEAGEGVARRQCPSPNHTGEPRTPHLAPSEGPCLSLDVIASLPLWDEGLRCPSQAALSLTPGHGRQHQGTVRGAVCPTKCPMRCPTRRRPLTEMDCLQASGQKSRQAARPHTLPHTRARVD